jgi:hypothetical protein
VTLSAVRAAIAQGRRGILVRCKGLKLRPRVQSIKWPKGKIAPGKRPMFRIRCSIDCAYTAQVLALKGNKVAATSKGRVKGGKLTGVALRAKLAPGRYRLKLSLVAPVNPGRLLNMRGPVFTTTKAR